MEALNKKYSREVDFQPGDVERAQAIVAEMLGYYACLEVGTFPKNVGVKGDSGVLGETVGIVPLGTPAQFFVEHPDLLAATANRLTGEIEAITRVLVIIGHNPDSGLDFPES